MIETDIAFDEPVVCDQSWIAQLLSNFLGNALTYGAPDTPICVWVRLDELVFELSVANAGDPISPAAMERLFRSFMRGAVRPSQQGLGLDLFIASEVARANNGTLKVVSSTAKTRFMFHMPVAKALPTLAETLAPLGYKTGEWHSSASLLSGSHIVKAVPQDRLAAPLPRPCGIGLLRSSGPDPWLRPIGSNGSALLIALTSWPRNIQMQLLQLI